MGNAKMDAHWKKIAGHLNERATEVATARRLKVDRRGTDRPPHPEKAHARLQATGSIAGAARSLHASVHAVTWALTQGGFPLVAEVVRVGPMIRCPECLGISPDTTCPNCHALKNQFLDATPEPLHATNKARGPRDFLANHPHLGRQATLSLPDALRSDDLPEDDPDPDFDA
jgi:hypothetical protein